MSIVTGPLIRLRLTAAHRTSLGSHLKAKDGVVRKRGVYIPWTLKDKPEKHYPLLLILTSFMTLAESKAALLKAPGT